MKFVADERKGHTVYPPAEQVFTWTQTCDIRDVSSPHLENQITHTSTKHARQNEDLLVGKAKDDCRSQKSAKMNQPFKLGMLAQRFAPIQLAVNSQQYYCNYLRIR